MSDINKFSKAVEHNYDFWKTKPVPKLLQKNIKSKQIKTDAEIQARYGKTEETKLPTGLKWDMIEIKSDKIKQITDFLCENYKMDNIIIFTVEKMRWETKNKGFFMCIKKNDTDEIIGCIGLTEKHIQINLENQHVAEAIYLCCNAKMRKSGMSKVLINEIIRQGSLQNYNVGAFCTNMIVPSPIATIRYYTRPLDYKYLKANDFTSVGDIDDDVAHNRIKIKLKPPKTVYIAKNSPKNVKIVHKLYTEYMKTFNLHNILSEEDVEHYFFNADFTKTIFYEDDKGNVVDFLCYRFFNIINIKREVTADDKYGNTIKATAVLSYSSNFFRPDIIMINAFKVISLEKHHMVYLPDMMGTNDIILSSVRKGDEDTQDEDQNAIYDQHILKSSKKQFINLFNWECPVLSQNMLSYMIFN